MDIWKSLGGTLRLELICANIADLLTILNQNGIYLENVLYRTELSVEITIRRKDYDALCSCAERKGCSVKIVSKGGIFWTCQHFLKRKILLWGMMFLIVLSLVLPSRIFFVTVTGNENLSSAYIIQQAAKSGIDFGASRRTIRSEKIKNALLAGIPQLEWVGINTQGCLAIISVQERTEQEQQESSSAVSRIVAASDGVVQDMTVIRGTPLCKIGQAVKAGQTLISGYTDCGAVIQATKAEGEVYARTLYYVSAATLGRMEQRCEIVRRTTGFSFFVGKKLINLSPDSGISDATCVKMYQRKNVTLPGGFCLPIGWIREDIIYYDTVQAEQAAESIELLLRQCCAAYLRQGKVAVQVIGMDGTFQEKSDAFAWAGKISCYEMIGRVDNEEIVIYNGENR